MMSCVLGAWSKFAQLQSRNRAETTQCAAHYQRLRDVSMQAAAALLGNSESSTLKTAFWSWAECSRVEREKLEMRTVARNCAQKAIVAMAAPHQVLAAVLAFWMKLCVEVRRSKHFGDKIVTILLSRKGVILQVEMISVWKMATAEALAEAELVQAERERVESEASILQRIEHIKKLLPNQADWDSFEIPQRIVPR